ncbi:hypothetical protein K466DRAFT_668218 [Polyporus arcularius HHB13444]|uniref:Uncharacterized protein n=1 Tax=Polyporus arcularius HHB13444 TaxID=1314778 RepID=A0A5C3NSZ5_9APHY|nr:hypothetical protein K466DRAFT_668218 [Polyporus arcularius HHB13444]
MDAIKEVWQDQLTFGVPKGTVAENAFQSLQEKKARKARKPHTENNKRAELDALDLLRLIPYLGVPPERVQRDHHIANVQGSLVRFSRILGRTPPGTFTSAAVAGLAGVELLNGILFAWARLTLDQLGWMREGQGDAGWDRHGFFSA